MENQACISESPFKDLLEEICRSLKRVHNNSLIRKRIHDSSANNRKSIPELYRKEINYFLEKRHEPPSTNYLIWIKDIQKRVDRNRRENQAKKSKNKPFRVIVKTIHWLDSEFYGK